MDYAFWQKQTEEPLFKELEWNKPERRDQAGRLLIIGGTVHELTAPAKAFDRATKTGIGTTKLALPEKTKRLVGKSLPEAVFLPSTPSGELSSEGTHELLEYALWADTLLLTGDNGRNSQTTILFEELLQSFNGQAVLTRDAVDILISSPATLLERPNTTLVVSFAQLQKIMQSHGQKTPLVFTMDLVKLIDFLHTFTRIQPCGIITLHQNQLITAINGRVSTTKISTQNEPKHWRLETATTAACYQTWNPHQPFESLTQAVYTMVQPVD